MPEFLYKPEYVDISLDGAQRELVPGQIQAEFRGDESAMEWMAWLKDNGFPSPIGAIYFPTEDPILARDRDYAVWSPSQDHMMLHRLTWGGKMAG